MRTNPPQQPAPRAPKPRPAATVPTAPGAAGTAPPPPDEATRERLLAAARELFTAGGFRGTSTRAIASRAGCNLSLIKYYFGSKEGLLREVMRPTLNQVRFLIEAMAGDEAPSPERIRAFFLGMARQIDARRDFMRLIFAEMLRSDSRLGDELLENVGVNQQAGLATLERARDAGVIRGDLDLRCTLLVAMSSTLFYHLGDPLTSRLVGPRTPEVIERLARTAADIFLHGVLRPPPSPAPEDSR